LCEVSAATILARTLGDVVHLRGVKQSHEGGRGKTSGSAYHALLPAVLLTSLIFATVLDGVLS